MILYRDIFKQALQTSWRHKYLWVFGLFAAMLSNGGELEMIIKGYDGEPEKAVLPSFRYLADAGLFSQSALSNLKSLLVSNPFGLFMLLTAVLLIIILTLFLVWSSITSQAALVTAAAKDRLGKLHNFRESLQAGLKHFWPVLSVNLVFRVVNYAIFILLTWPIVLIVRNQDYSWASLAFIAGFIVFAPLSIVLSFVAKYAVAYVVLRGAALSESFKKAWQLFVRNWLISLEMAFFLFFLNFLVAAALILAVLVLAIPLFLFLAILISLQLTYLYSLLIMAMAVLMVAVIAVVGAMLSCFQIASWTGLFIELESKGGASKLNRLIGRV